MTKQMKRNANNLNEDTTTIRSRSMALPSISLFVPVIKPKQPNNTPEPFDLGNNDNNKSTDDEGDEYNELKCMNNNYSNVTCGNVAWECNDEECDKCCKGNKIISVRKVTILDRLKNKRKYSHMNRRHKHI